MNFKTLNDEQLVSNIQQSGCSDSIVELTERHTKLVSQIMKRYAGASQCSGVAMRDFLDEKNFIVFEAARKFDESKNIKFSTWLGNNVRYYCLNTLNKQSKYYTPARHENVIDHTDKGLADYLSDAIATEEYAEQSKIEDQMEYVMNILSQFKDKRIEKIIRMRYLEGAKKCSFSVIAKALKMSTQGVIDLHDSFIKFVGEKMRSEQNMDKI